MRINVLGKKASIITNATVEAIKELAQYRPDTLVVKDDNGDVVFKVGIEDGRSSVSVYGITFDSSLTKPTQRAVAEFTIEDETSSAVEIVKKYGNVFDMLKIVEQQIVCEYMEISEAAKELEDVIEIVTL